MEIQMQAAVEMMSKRTADTFADFFLPLLEPPMRVLDAGSGPGTITVGLAEAVAPGQVMGIDMDEQLIRASTQLAKDKNLTNLQFRVGNVYNMAFADDTFDAAFAHALLEDLGGPVEAMLELHRILKPGGIIGVSSHDWGGYLFWPTNPILEAAFKFYLDSQAHHGRDLYVGRRLISIVREAGFSDVNVSGTYRIYEPGSYVVDYIAHRIELALNDDPMLTPFVGVGRAEIEAMATAVRAWNNHSDAMFAQSWISVTARCSS